MARSGFDTFLRIKSAGLMICATLLFGAACASKEVKTAPQYEAAYHDQARVPQSNYMQHSDQSIQPQSSADYHYTLGEANSLDGRTQEAIDEFKASLVYDPGSLPLRIRLASEYVKAGRVEQAIQILEEVKAKDPSNTEARMLLGGIYGSIKNYPESLAEYDSVLQKDPKHFEAHLYLGAVYAEQKLYSKALKHFDLLVKEDEDPLVHLAWYYKGRVHLDMETPDAAAKAIHSFKTALKGKPHYVEAVFALAQAHLKENNSSAAIQALVNFQNEQGPSLRVAEMLTQFHLEKEEFEAALEQLSIIEKSPDEMLNAKVRIALVLIELKRYQEAAEKLNEVLLFAPDSDKVRFYLGAVYEELDMKDRAVENFQAVPATSPYFAEAMIHGSYLLRVEKKTEEALALANRGLEFRPDVPQLYAIKASLLDDKKEYIAAIDLLNEGIAKFPDNLQLLFFLGTVYDHVDDKKSVIATMENVLALDPKHSQAMNYLAYTLAEQGLRLDEAKNYAERAMSLEPEDGYIQDTYGWILHKMGKHEEALIHLEEALKKQPGESVIAEHLGDVYMRLSMPEKARNLYEQAASSTDSKERSTALRQKITGIQTQVLPSEPDRLPASSK